MVQSVSVLVTAGFHCYAGYQHLTWDRVLDDCDSRGDEQVLQSHLYLSHPLLLRKYVIAFMFETGQIICICIKFSFNERRPTSGGS